LITPVWKGTRQMILKNIYILVALNTTDDFEKYLSNTNVIVGVKDLA
jgi:hypothetical protein